MIIMKFGGTSLEDATSIYRVTHIIEKRIQDKPVVVVSAMGKTTNQLIQSARLAEFNHLKDSIQILQQLKKFHLEVIHSLLHGHRLELAQQHIEKIIHQIQQILEGITIIHQLSPSTLDTIMAHGEILSSYILTQTMNENGLKAELIDIRKILITDDSFGNAIPILELIDLKVNETMLPLLKNKIIPVTQGFIGSTMGGSTTTLGRGGSDYSASILGSALKSLNIQIWTDVDGMMTADPAIVPEAHPLSDLSYQEALELAYFGAKVLHPGAVIPAIKSKIPIYILNSKNPDYPGTLIQEKCKKNSLPVKSIAYKKNVIALNIVPIRIFPKYGFLTKILEIFEKRQVPLDMICTSELKLLLAIDDQYFDNNVFRQLKEVAEVKLDKNKALVCLVGENMRASHGLAAQIFSVISQFNIHGISQGASEINMTFMIDEKNVTDVILRLHRQFFN